MAFLTARWSNLCLFTYAVPRDLLTPRLPPGLELDGRDDLDGEAFVSLVAFDFLDTKVLDIPWPGYRNFAEINLRFYVRRPTPAGVERGVVFIREFVPRQLVAWMARAIYNEPYLAAPLVSRVVQESDSISVEHRLTFAGQENVITLSADGVAECPPESSIEHFFKEHRWGYGRTRGGKLLRYEVAHPRWDCHRVRSWKLDLDWSGVYGKEWAFLGDQQPISTILAAGSKVAVYPKSGRVAFT